MNIYFLLGRGLKTQYLFDIPDIPDVDGVVIVDDGNFKVLFVVGDCRGVRISCIGGMGCHVRDR